MYTDVSLTSLSYSSESGTEYCINASCLLCISFISFNLVSYSDCRVLNLLLSCSTLSFCVDKPDCRSSTLLLSWSTSRSLADQSASKLSTCLYHPYTLEFSTALYMIHVHVASYASSKQIKIHKNMPLLQW